MKLIKNVLVYSPKKEGIRDILLGGGKILKIEKNIEMDDCDIIDGSGCCVIPGLIDQHVHICGGGGEGGFRSKTPEATVSDFILGGVTTIVGLLGTDGYSRSIENLLSKAKGLKEEGLSVLCCTGSYGYPSCTFSGSVAKDVCFIEEIIGCKIALSDHRSSHINKDDLKKLASEVRVAGLLSNKAGILCVHMGTEASGMSLINEVLDETDLPITLFRPTHVARCESLFQEALSFNKKGGFIDLTVNESMADKLRIALNNGNSDKVTISSDGQGSYSLYDKEGKCIEIGVSSISSLFNTIIMLVKQGFLLEDILSLATKNVAVGLNCYPKKGCIQVGSDADLIVLSETYQMKMVLLNGEVVFKDGILLRKGMFD